MDDKRELRAALGARRWALTPAQRRERSAAAARHLVDLPELAAAGTVALYAALPDEADPAPARRPLERRGCRIALPRVLRDGALALVAVEGALEPGFRGVLEPSGDPLPLDQVRAVVVPGVAFDRDGARLGRGGGHYDRLLAALPPSVATVGFAFAFQLVEHVPVLDHDRPVDLVVTEQEVVRPAAPPT